MIDLRCGDSRIVLASLAPDSIDACVCDPPYELGFMGKKWDSTGIAYDVELWAAVFRVLKPGAHLLAFGGSRTYHRMACAIEDAGFDIRDQLQWVYATGFPKSLNVSKQIDAMAGAVRVESGRKHTGCVFLDNGKPCTGHGDGGQSQEGQTIHVRETLPATPDAAQWDGWGTALKPAHEPIVLARKPLTSTVTRNVLVHGTGAINIGACRIGVGERYNPAASNPTDHATVAHGAIPNPHGYEGSTVIGRWPSNVILGHGPGCRVAGAGTGRRPGGFGDVGADGGSGEPNAATYGVETVDVWECEPGCPVAMIDAQSGRSTSPGEINQTATRSGLSGLSGLSGQGRVAVPGDAGGASRFFYCPKTSTAEREAGLDDLDVHDARGTVGRDPGSAGTASPRAGAGRKGTRRNVHPTVKPIDLMRWLVRLVTRPGGLVLDPFAGSGSTAVACVLEGVRHIGIELDPVHVEIARGRVAEALALGLATDRETGKTIVRNRGGQASLFDLPGVPW